MGLLDFLKGKKEEEEPKKFFSLKANFNPIRLKKDSSVDLYVTVKNLRDEDTLTSVLLIAPQSLGFDSTGVNNAREIRLDVLKGGEEKTLVVPVRAAASAEPGEYEISIAACAHYKDYDHVIGELRKRVVLRVV